ncbi:PaaI family thioesterase [Litoreibacter roseus]|uniref:Thioesterase n=1 Tax=Litoreibacter roseus TaxID=2601869 RepID=A0A6N6JBA7_9RHOB|nr:PaaI family thioesterase [Litoreibacter roseus]GFE63455.1 thioesterase [Litoreibacter roseus]
MSNQYAAKSPDELPSRETLLSMSGLEFMHGMASGALAGPPIAGLLNYRVTMVQEGHVEFRGSPEFQHTNPMGTVHGGWYGSLLDSAMACAVMTTVPKGSAYTTLEYKVNIVRSIPLGMDIVASGTVEHAGRSTGVANGWIKGVDDGKLYATGSTTCIIMKMT